MGCSVLSSRQVSQDWVARCYGCVGGCPQFCPETQGWKKRDQHETGASPVESVLRPGPFAFTPSATSSMGVQPWQWPRASRWGRRHVSPLDLTSPATSAAASTPSIPVTHRLARGTPCPPCQPAWCTPAPAQSLPPTIGLNSFPAGLHTMHQDWQCPAERKEAQYHTSRPWH